MQVDRVEALASATDRREERDVSPVVDRGRVEARDRPRRNVRRGGARERDRPRATRRGDEDTLDRPGADDRGGERELPAFVERRDRMAAEPREHAATGRRVAIRGELADPLSRRDEQPFA